MTLNFGPSSLEVEPTCNCLVIEITGWNSLHIPPKWSKKAEVLNCLFYNAGAKLSVFRSARISCTTFDFFSFFFLLLFLFLLLFILFSHPSHPRYLCQGQGSISRTFLKQFVLFTMLVPNCPFSYLSAKLSVCLLGAKLSIFTILVPKCPAHRRFGLWPPPPSFWTYGWFLFAGLGDTLHCAKIGKKKLQNW